MESELSETGSTEVDDKGKNKEVRRLSGESLIEQRDGLCIDKQFAEMIYNGDKEYIVSDTEWKNKIGKRMYLADSDYAYGTIKLHKPEKINLEKLKSLEDKHKINGDLRERWWPKKELFFLYDFDFNKFDQRKPIKFSMENSSWGRDVFITDVELSKTIQNIKDVDDYDPSKMTNRQLMDDWRIAIAWASQKMDKGDW